MAERPSITLTSGASNCPLLIVHGGAGIRRTPYTAERDAAAAAALRRALDAGMGVLDAGGAAEDAVVAAVHELENDPVFNSAHGAALTCEGTAELDSCIMRGDGSTGAVTCTSFAKNPIDAARAVMERTPHALVACPSKEQLEAWGVTCVPNEYFVTARRQAELDFIQSRLSREAASVDAHGTVGCVARDAQGRLCAGTSTGGIPNQLPGRVGDTPVCGAGTYANAQTVAVSCTGTGEVFLREVAGYQVHARVRWASQAPRDAVSAVLEAVEDAGGDGGAICVPVVGEGVVGRNARAQMDWGIAFGEERIVHT